MILSKNAKFFIRRFLLIMFVACGTPSNEKLAIYASESDVVAQIVTAHSEATHRPSYLKGLVTKTVSTAADGQEMQAKTMFIARFYCADDHYRIDYLQKAFNGSPDDVEIEDILTTRVVTPDAFLQLNRGGPNTVHISRYDYPENPIVKAVEADLIYPISSTQHVIGLSVIDVLQLPTVEINEKDGVIEITLSSTATDHTQTKGLSIELDPTRAFVVERFFQSVNPRRDAANYRRCNLLKKDGGSVRGDEGRAIGTRGVARSRVTAD